ncbi:MAG: FAD/NAD(P)-binding protein [Planctomycetes bacterium]|nr:FAD/NAD(P)-binding protein [Planctomycetota bacterium]
MSEATVQNRAPAGADAPRSIYLPEPATLVDVRPMTKQEKFFRFQMARAEGMKYMPGQFAEISLPGIGECPISISSSPTRNGDGSFEMVIRSAGAVTAALHRLSPGDRVGVRGPFGTHFPVEDEFRGKDLVFICGGIGLVPVRSAIHYVLDQRDDYRKITVLFGARSPEERLFIGELYDLKTRKDVFFQETVDVADPTWGGNVGVITTLMPQLRLEADRTVVIICGPPIMYKFVLLELRKLQVANRNIYVSLERHMKCGVGKCGHCQINGLYACQDGPVFRYADISSVREAI